MSYEARLLLNLTDYFMRCTGEELARHVHLLSCELVARGLRGDALGFELARMLRRQVSPPRAEAYARQLPLHVPVSDPPPGPCVTCAAGLTSGCR